MVAFQLDIVEILFHGPHMIACCALSDVRQPLHALGLYVNLLGERPALEAI